MPLKRRSEPAPSLSGYVSLDGGYEFDCSLAADPRDTDGDGISDGLEVFGLLVNDQVVATDTSSQLALIGTVGPGAELPFQTHINLPLWGADPRHKDLFVEIDFMMRMPGEAEQRLSVMLPASSPHTTRIRSTIPARWSISTGQCRSSIRTASVVSARISTPVSRRRRPKTRPSYGDWGGFDAVPPVQNSDGSWRGACLWSDDDYECPRPAWMDNMAPARLVFSVISWPTPAAAARSR